MVGIFIQGIKDGLHDVGLKASVIDIPDMFPEFFGEITVSGKIRKFGSRYTLIARAECKANLVCDLSLEDYEDLITIELNASYLASSLLKGKMADGNMGEKEENIISEDAKSIDISNLLREEFALNLPMKRIAPQYRDKSYEEMYPEYAGHSDAGTEDTTDDRWAPLKKIKLN